MTRACTLCPLTLPAQVAGYGPKDAKLIVVGDFPTTDDERTGIPFSISRNPKHEGATALARRFIKAMGLDPELDVFWVYALRCNVNHRKEKVTVHKEKHLGVCKNHLERDLTGVTAPVMLLLGNHAVSSVLDLPGGVGPNRVFPHHVTIGGMRRLAFVSFSPAVVDRRTLWELKPDGTRGKRLDPIGSTLRFFKDDLRSVREELVTRGLLPAKTA